MADHGPTTIDLFAGCGGLSRGFSDVGCRIVAGVESQQSAAATFAVNFPESRTFHRDIQHYRFSNIESVDLIIGGPPCQGFSNLGRRDPGDLRNRMWKRYVRVVKGSECKVFVIENVDRFAESNEVRALRRATQRGGALDGFEIEVYTLNAADFGVSQRRQRTFVIGSRIGPIGPPEPTHQRDPGGPLPQWLTVRDAIEDLDWPVDELELPDRTIDLLGDRSPGAFKLQEIHVGRRYMSRSLERFRYIRPGGGRHDLPDRLKSDCWLNHSTGSSDVLGRLDWDKPSVTIRTEFFKPEKGRYLHPAMDRAITHAEAALLQGFDDRHLWCGSKVEIARQIGNAVPPPLARSIGRRVVTAFAH